MYIYISKRGKLRTRHWHKIFTCLGLTRLAALALKVPTSNPSVPTTQPSPGCINQARQVKIQASPGEQIQVFEVEVMSSGVNVASSATQSSTLRSFVADRAVDGDEKSFSHTADSNAWLEIDLQSLHDIDSVNIINRYCKDPADSPGCLCRLSEAELSLIDSNGVVVATRSLGDTCNRQMIVLSFKEGCISSSPSVVS